MARNRLDDAAITTALAGAAGWTLAADKSAIARTFEFRNFSEAFAFMTRVALLAAKMDHHPEWSNVYNRVSVVLTTHDAKGVPQLDVSLAAYMDQLV